MPKPQSASRNGNGRAGLRAPAPMPDILRMSVTRGKLYEEVWAEPMVRVAVRHGVSANYLARVCDYLNVPYPHRGYWAKRQFGKAPTRLPLPAPRRDQNAPLVINCSLASGSPSRGPDSPKWDICGRSSESSWTSS